MPGNVPAVDVAVVPVMPRSLSTVFTSAREFAVLVNEYPDGASQRYVLISNGGDREDILPRHRWKISKRLTPEKLVALRDFYDEVGAGPFIFYDPFEAVEFGNFHETGGSEDGRFICHFTSPWVQEMGIGRGNVSLEFMELAQAFGTGALDFEDEDNSGQVAGL